MDRSSTSILPHMVVANQALANQALHENTKVRGRTVVELASYSTVSVFTRELPPGYSLGHGHSGMMSW